MRKAHAFFDKIKSTRGSVAIVIHSGGDPDAVASAFSLKLLIEKLNPEVSVSLFAPGGLNEDGTRLSEKLGLFFQETSSLKDFEVIVLTDTVDLSHASLTLDDISQRGEILVVDHHKMNYPDYVKLALADKRKSTSELMIQLYDEVGETLDRNVSWALAIGIIYDTARLTASDNRSLLALSRLAQSGLDIVEALSWMRVKIKEDERIARIKAAQRVKMVRSQGFLIGISKVGSYNSSAASGLLSLGFDLAVVTSKGRSALTISIRTTPEFYEKTGLSVGDEICQEFCKLYGGSGGGHECVGIIHYHGSEEDFSKTFLDFLDVTLKNKSKILGNTRN